MSSRPEAVYIHTHAVTFTQEEEESYTEFIGLLHRSGQIGQPTWSEYLRYCCKFTLLATHEIRKHESLEKAKPVTNVEI